MDSILREYNSPQLPDEIFKVVGVPAFAAKLRSCDFKVIICYLQAVCICINFSFYFLGIDLSVRIPVYTFTCTYFYCLVYIAYPVSL